MRDGQGGTREDVIHNGLDLCQNTIDESLGEGCNHGAWLAMAWWGLLKLKWNGVNCRPVLAGLEGLASCMNLSSSKPVRLSLNRSAAADLFWLSEPRLQQSIVRLVVISDLVVCGRSGVQAFHYSLGLYVCLWAQHVLAQCWSKDVSEGQDDMAWMDMVHT